MTPYSAIVVAGSCPSTPGKLSILAATAGDAISVPRRTMPMPIDWRGVYADAEVGFGSETVRAPRRPLVGEERERVLRIIRTAIATRPRSPAR